MVTLALTAVMAFLLGVTSGGLRAPSPPLPMEFVAPDPPPPVIETPTPAINRPVAIAPGLVNFADVAESLNPAVVNIEAITRSGSRRRRTQEPSPFDDTNPVPQGPGVVRPQSGSGFVIEGDGQILTNYHVIQNAERIMVKFSDGRSLQARVLGIDPDTDIALIKVDARNLPVAPMGDSETLRVGEWVCAIGNPLAYEHTVTVGVVSYLGRKLFDPSLDNYIQTDAAINFGNSGGPLINGRGEVVGINSAISQRASNIGFAVPINEARSILPQLKSEGRVARGYMGVTLSDVDPDLQRSLGLKSSDGALVQDVTAGSPGARAGIRTYDLIVAVDGAAVAGNDQLIQLIAARQPGTTATLQIVRDGRPMNMPIKLAERPPRDRRPAPGTEDQQPQPSSQRGPALGISVREIDSDFATRFRLPDGTQGVIVSRIEPMSPAFDADIERGHVLLEINRQPVRSIDDYRRLTSGARAGDILTLYLYKPEIEQRALHTVKIEN